MCGILCSLKKDELCALIERRGPDAVHSIVVDSLLFCASLLHLRGEKTPQPLMRENALFMWNGQVYDGIEMNEQDNDTEAVFRAIQQKGLFETLDAVQGEFAFVYYARGMLSFGRDRVGRRSMVRSMDHFAIASALENQVCMDLEPLGVYTLPAHMCQSEAWYNACTILPWSTKLVKEVDPMNAASLIAQLISVLKEAVRTRLVANHVQRPIAVLFSGGLDCMVIAALIDRILDASIPVDLLNVAFENPRTKQPFHRVPDRITAIQGLQELSRTSHREWRLVEINVSFDEMTLHEDHIARLAHPSATIMDMSIAKAFWFAGRGQGNVLGKPYTSPAKILFSGLGADEQLAGYSRHRVQYERGGYEMVKEELKFEIKRIGIRNLGRDDRVLSDHGKEARYPYLDEQVMALFHIIPIELKLQPLLPRGEGEKLILREAARTLGLSMTSKEPKRAIQFGARTAKMRSGKEKGHFFIEFHS